MNDTNQKMDRRALLGLGAAAMVTAGGIVVAGRAGLAHDAMGTPEASPMASPMASPSASPVAGGGVMVKAIELAFEPNAFTIPANTDVMVTIENAGVLEHDFHIDDLDVMSDLLAAGTSGTVTINAAPGTYEFYCSVAGHKEAGMVGTLTVE